MKDNIQTCLVAAAIVAVLAGCATARVSDATRSSSSGAQPVEILVDVTTDSQASAAQTVRADLQANLVKKLTAARVFAEPYSAAAQHSGVAVLHVTITEADPGNAVKRFVIGLGAGRARLQAAAELWTQAAIGSAPVVAFNTSSDSGRGPGLLAAGGVAVATGAAVPLAIGGGIDLAQNAHGAFDKPLKATSRSIVDQLKSYYGSVGWSWPTADRAQHS